MKVFSTVEITEALAYASRGKVALHIHAICFSHSPKCFRDAVNKRKECIAHLFDQDKERLWSKVKSLGVSVIFIHHTDREEQHVDLCGAPLKRLITEHYGKLLRLGKTKAVNDLREILSKFSGSERWI